MARVVRRVGAMVVTVVLATVGAGATWPSTAGATAAEPPNATLTVFVGTVESTAGSGLWANVHVEEVWEGDVPERLTLAGAALRSDGRSAGPSSEQRTYTTGARYVFFSLDSGDGPRALWGPYADGDGPRFEDAAGSNTHVFDASEDDALRPPTAKPPTPGSALVDPPTGRRLPLTAIAFGLVFVVGIALVIVLGRRRSRAA